jgi:FlaA1/EpsC-like NDP-sugar epimerase
VADALVIAACWNITYLFRLGFERWISARPAYDGWVLLGVVAAYLAAFALLRVPQSMWRFSGFGEVKRLTLACALAGIGSAAVIMGLGLSKVPRAVLALHPVITLMGVCVVRIAYRMLYEHARSRITGGSAEIRRALVLGAGDAAKWLLAGIHQQGWTVLGLLDDDPAKQQSRIAGVQVLGPLEAVGDAQVRGAATHLVIAMPSATPAQRRRALELAAATGLPVLTVPSAAELADRQQRNQRVRDIEPEDLLGREPVQLDEAGIGATLRGKTVLITGAGGSIGSELCRQVARFEPARLVLLRAERVQPLHDRAGAGRELPAAAAGAADRRRQGPGPPAPHLCALAAAGGVPCRGLQACAADGRSRQRLGGAAQQHAGHVPRRAGRGRSGAERFVLISTDKAVNPTNVMGATKRAAEMVVSPGGRAPGTRFIAVRFGNVLGSSGSVIPKFKEQIERGGPVTVTHPDIIRYFMTIPEAARLVLQAAAIGDSGQVLVLDMGEPVKIVDLARDLIRLAGHAPEEIAIEFTGLRPGEKLYEELLAPRGSCAARLQRAIAGASQAHLDQHLRVRRPPACPGGSGSAA